MSDDRGKKPPGDDDGWGDVAELERAVRDAREGGGKVVSGPADPLADRGEAGADEAGDAALAGVTSGAIGAGAEAGAGAAEAGADTAEAGAGTAEAGADTAEAGAGDDWGQTEAAAAELPEPPPGWGESADAEQVPGDWGQTATGEAPGDWGQAATGEAPGDWGQAATGDGGAAELAAGDGDAAELAAGDGGAAELAAGDGDAPATEAAGGEVPTDWSGDGDEPLPPPGSLEEAVGVEADEAPRKRRLSRKQLAAVAGAAAVVLVAGGVGVASWLNSQRYFFVCGSKAITAERGSAWPWGRDQLGGDHFRPIPIPASYECADRELPDRAALEAAFLEALIARSSALLTSGDPEAVAEAQAELQQALYLTRAPERRDTREVVERLQGDVEYWQAAAEVEAAIGQLEQAAERFEAAAARGPQHNGDAEAWAAHARAMGAEIRQGPPALRAQQPAAEADDRPRFAGTGDDSPLSAAAQAETEVSGEPAAAAEPADPATAEPADPAATAEPAESTAAAEPTESTAAEPAAGAANPTPAAAPNPDGRAPSAEPALPRGGVLL